jgi:hypothetical protein
MSVPAAWIHLDREDRPKPPRTPDQIRSLLIKIAEAVRGSAVRDPW